jgi:hypothetical protein
MAKRKKMTVEHKQKIREGVWLHMYGPNWQEIVRQRKEAETVRIGQARLAFVKGTAPKDEFGSPIEGVWVPPLNKREFLRLLVIRLRGELPNREFVELARIYAELRRWVGRRNQLGNNRNPKGNSVAEPVDEETLKPEEDVMDMVRRIEEGKG